MSSDDHKRDALLMGEQDFYDGVPIGDCPYATSITEPDGDLAAYWCRGWCQAEVRAAKATLDLQLQPVCADNAAERALVASVINRHHAADARTDRTARTLH